MLALSTSGESAIQVTGQKREHHAFELVIVLENVALQLPSVDPKVALCAAVTGQKPQRLAGYLFQRSCSSDHPEDGWPKHLAKSGLPADDLCSYCDPLCTKRNVAPKPCWPRDDQVGTEVHTQTKTPRDGSAPEMGSSI
jgi:hypothetical protein